MVHACPDADYSMPMKRAIEDKQVELVRVVGGQTYICTMFRPATPHEEELFRVTLTAGVQAVFSLPVCVYIGNEHRGKTATLQVLRGYRVWQDMEKDVTNLGKKCLRCQDFKGGKMVQGALSGVLRSESVGEV